MPAMKLFVCIQKRYAPNPHSCGNGGALLIAAKLEQELAKAGLNVVVERMGCQGACLLGPNVQLLPEGKCWHGVSEDNVAQIVAYLQQHNKN
jgi:(2Fe-2S) ferredoxin